MFACLYAPSRGLAFRSAEGVPRAHCVTDALLRLARLQSPCVEVHANNLVVLDATGLADLAAEEIAGLHAALPGARIRATGDMIGHPMEVAAPFGAALAAALCAAGSAAEVAVTSVGHRRGEGVIRVVRI